MASNAKPKFDPVNELRRIYWDYTQNPSEKTFGILFLCAIMQAYILVSEGEPSVVAGYTALVFLTWGAFTNAFHSMVEEAVSDKNLRLHQHFVPFKSTYLFWIGARGFVSATVHFVQTMLLVVLNTVWYGPDLLGLVSIWPFVIALFVFGLALGMVAATLAYFFEAINLVSGIFSLAGLSAALAVGGTLSHGADESVSVAWSAGVLLIAALLLPLAYMISSQLVGSIHRRLLV